MGFIPEEVIDEVQQRNEIVGVISSYIPLKRSGANFKALCPFHREKTPSFMVSPTKQIWHCFGCNLGGNVVNFVMKYEKLEFPEAVRMLAKKAGVQIPETKVASAEARSKLKKLYEANELAAKYFRKNLLDQGVGKLARDYLKKRQIEEETSQKFRLGYAPQRWDGFLTHAKGVGFTEETLKDAGLILSGEEGRYYDRFRNKLIFPILDLQGGVIGFGGRVLDESLPKYVNSPETQIFKKGRNLYGLNLAKDQVRSEGYIIVVEGYMDLLMLYQNGIRSVVASLGTALTQEQLRLVKRFAETIYMVYDPDRAGELASLRALDLAVEEGLRVKVVTLPEGSDPDDYVRTKGPESFREQLDHALDLFDYKLGLLSRRYDTTKVEDIAKVTAEMLPTIARVQNAVLLSGYIKELAKRLAVDEGALMVELRKVKERGASYYPPEPQRSSPTMRSEERTLIKLMLEDVEVGRRVKDSLDPEDFTDPRAKRIVGALFKLISDARPLDPSRLMSRFEDDELNQLISGLLVSMDEYQDRMKVACDCIKRMRDLNLKHRRASLAREIRLAEAAGDDSQRMKLLAEFQALLGTSKEKR